MKGEKGWVRKEETRQPPAAKVQATFWRSSLGGRDSCKLQRGCHPAWGFSGLLEGAVGPGQREGQGVVVPKPGLDHLI